MAVTFYNGVFKEVCSGYSVEKRKVSGIISYESDGFTVNGHASFVNALSVADGGYFLVAYSGGERLNVDLGKNAVSVDFNFNFNGNGVDFLLLHKGLSTKIVAEYLTLNSHSFYAELYEKPTVYDDYAIAEENYYLREIDNSGYYERESFSDKNALFKSQSAGTTSSEGKDSQALFDEKFAGDLSGESGYWEGIKKDFIKALSTYQKEEELNGVILSGDFIRITRSGGKSYVLGLIGSEENPSYLVYGFDGTYGFPPEKIKGVASFIPKSLFDINGKGYYLIFQDPFSGNIIKK